MRAQFDDSFTVRHGTRSITGPALVVWGVGVPCRKVPQHEISQHQLPLDLSSRWVTFNPMGIHGPSAVSPWLGAMFHDYLAADQVAFASDPGVWYVVCREELVEHPGDVPYSRCLLIPLTSVVYPVWPPRQPLPPEPWPCVPGVTCLTACDLATHQEVEHVYVEGEYWWHCAPLLADDYFFALNVFDGDCDWEFYIGEECETRVLIDTGSGSICRPFSLLDGGECWVKLIVTGEADVSLNFERGTCP